jgi:RNA polymerase sigma factor (sigma-70 family)
MSPRLSDLLLRSQSDERLVSLAQAGHDRAFATIVERYRPELLAMARRLVTDGRAEDVLQQALLSAFSALRSGTEVSHVRGWLYQIVRNAATKTRQVDEAPLDEMTASGPALEEVVQQRALAMSAMSEISRLPERQRDALVGSALGGLGRAELAASMGLSEGAVRQLVHRARAAVRTAVTAVTPWPLANWLASMPGAAGGTSEVVAAAGALSGGGIAVKLGALLVTGAVATGVAVAPRSHDHAGAHVSRAATVPARAHIVRSAVLPAAALPTVARVGAGERHHGRGRDDSRSRDRGERFHSGSGRGGDAQSRRGGSDEGSSHGSSDGGSSDGSSDGGSSDGSSDGGSSNGSSDGGSTHGSSDGGSSHGSGDGGSTHGSSDGGSTHGAGDGGSSHGSDDGSSHDLAHLR